MMDETSPTGGGVRINGRLLVAEAELTERFVRAGGPGGQNVNKVATAVELRFDVRGASRLSPAQRARLEKLAGNRMTGEGELVIRAERFRTQERNRADARARLAELIARALRPPRTRVATRPTRGSKERRLKAKEKRGRTKRLRGAPRADD